jgi:hypothetical protein
MTKDFGILFFGTNVFKKEARKQFLQEWSKMTDSEKLEYMNKQVDSTERENFSTEIINTFCEEWWMKTPKEQETFVGDWEQAFENSKFEFSTRN